MKALNAQVVSTLPVKVSAVIATPTPMTAGLGVVRASFGVDVTVLPRLGATLGIETGAKAKDGDPGPTGTVLGAGLSYAFR